MFVQYRQPSLGGYVALLTLYNSTCAHSIDTYPSGLMMNHIVLSIIMDCSMPLSVYTLYIRLSDVVQLIYECKT